MRNLTGLLLSILAIPTYADTWLCIGEKGAKVTNDDNSVVSAKTFTSDQKWLLDKNGLRRHGTNVRVFDSCQVFNGRPSMCELAGEGWGGHFFLTPNNIFMLMGTDEDGDKLITFIIKGKCSKISVDQ